MSGKIVQYGTFLNICRNFNFDDVRHRVIFMKNTAFGSGHNGDLSLTEGAT